MYDMKEYNHKKIEKKWQKEWDTKKLYEAKDNSKKPKFYSLIEFPYPSGDGMHTGHLRSNTAMDVISRKRRAEGFNVLYPIGWDAFGLPTENYAIKTGQNPKVVTKKNTDNFRRQLKSMGFSFDWSREINTTDPEYYRWTQWIFLQMYKKGLAYKKKMAINWCPKDKIGLANEEVIDGKCERCGTMTEKREKEQWMLAITKYADRLDKDLDTVDYLEKIKIQQRNWIGRSEGMLFTAPVKGIDMKIQTFSAHFEAFAADTFVVIAPDHPLLPKLLEGIKDKNKILDFARKLIEKRQRDGFEEKEPEGIFTERYIVDPVGNGDLPIWVASYALADYGTGIVKCSAHDERDFAFAKKYNIPLKEVLEPLFIVTNGTDAVRRNLSLVERNIVVCIVKHWSEEKYLCLKWKKNDWRGFVTGGIEKGEDPIITGKREICEETGYKSAKLIRKVGGKVHSQFYHEIKKQNRFAHFDTFYFELQDGQMEDVDPKEKELHEAIWLSEKDVTEFVSKDEDMEFIWKQFISSPFPWVDMKRGVLTEPKEFSGKIAGDVRKEIIQYLEKNGLAEKRTTYKLRDWVFSRQRYWGEPIPMVKCVECGWVPVPEKELPVKLPEVKNYQPTDTGESPLATITKWVNVKCPQCGGKAERETDTMPNWAGSSWYYLRYTDSRNKKALAGEKNLKYWTPVDWYNGGMEHTTLHLLYSRFWHKFLFDLGIVPTSEPYQKRTSHGLILAQGGVKMSKSLGNVVNPDALVETYGADTLRVYEMFMGPFDQAIAWSTDNMVGSRRFIERVWRLQEKVQSGKGKNKKTDTTTNKLDSVIHKTIKKVGEDVEKMGFNTAISALMILLNEMEKEEILLRENYEILLKLLAPFAPHIADELWNILGHKKSIHLENWPLFDEKKVAISHALIVVQVNGKVRASFEHSDENVSEKEMGLRALALPEIKKWIGDSEVKKIIYVKNRLVNVVIG